ncbi:unnamed protein product [Closterium sp. NIES-53]
MLRSSVAQSIDSLRALLPVSHLSSVQIMQSGKDLKMRAGNYNFKTVRLSASLRVSPRLSASVRVGPRLSRSICICITVDINPFRRAVLLAALTASGSSFLTLPCSLSPLSPSPYLPSPS